MVRKILVVMSFHWALFAQAQSLQQVFTSLVSDYNNKDYQKVIMTGDSVLSLLSKNNSKQQSAYAYFSYFTGSAYAETDQFEKAELLLREAMETFKKIDNRSLEYGNACNNLGHLYFRSGENDKAVPLLQESLSVLKALKTGYHDYLFPPYINLANAYSYLGKLSEAESVLLELKTFLPPADPHQNQMVRIRLASIYTDMGQYSKAEAAINETLLYTEQVFGINSIEYAQAAMLSNKYYYAIQDYSRSEAFADKAILNYKLSGKADDPDLLQAINNLAYIYYFTGRLGQADSLFGLIQDKTRKLWGEGYPLFSNAGNGKALTLIGLGKYSEAITLLNQVMAIEERLKRTTGIEYETMMNNLGVAYARSGDTGNGEMFLLKALQLAENIFGKDHLEYKKVCSNLADLYWKINRVHDALSYYLLGMGILEEQEQQVASYSSEAEKIQFIRTQALDKHKYCSFICQVASKEHSGELYDANLFFKGFLLNSTKQVSFDILSSNDSSAIQLYTGWQNNKKNLAYWYSKPIKERVINLDSLKNIAEKEEKQLVRLSTEFNNTRESNKADWKTVKQHLKPGEAAIEFIQSIYFDHGRSTDSLIYYALVLKSNSEAPELVPLFEERQLASIMQIQNVNSANKINQFYLDRSSDRSVYEMVWSAIDEKLTGIHTVYFAPIGLLYKISFSAIAISDSSFLSDRYKLIQVNSTKELLESAEQRMTSADSLILYGGITYEPDSSKIKISSNQKITAPKALENIGAQTWNYLPFSRVEVEEIYKQGLITHYPVKIISGESATEESFKSLNGKRSPGFLHIATHGFFFPDPKEENIRMDIRQEVFKYSPDPMLRSGLFFAGAYYAWTKNKTDKAGEDGIATAFEIANMYLPHTKLCVLSACETGLGDLNGSEGVFGLQRAFRIAGVKNLLMSLWKVPDKETAEFMILFYKNLFHQQTIAEAFYSARETMKNKYRYEPYKWASFVLVR